MRTHEGTTQASVHSRVRRLSVAVDTRRKEGGGRWWDGRAAIDEVERPRRLDATTKGADQLADYTWQKATPADKRQPFRGRSREQEAGWKPEGHR